ncbi:SPOSA6832_00712 [Sporobolomyces salmonicolor]|uniref:U2 small nuclear ribonucleoprotein A' n=1 Tax=Sporidiobolus salmonicolor TaxID=5005 RepID=A0A0D6EHC9_SPOSA|nr:SPOSA6832_00712 [Sporobolomyces salmonicolor]
MVRLDADLLARTPSYLNPLHDRELDLRGHKIPAIENLGVTKDQLESLDLTDNAITSVSNFPLLRRLHQLLLANNPVRTVSPSVATSLPNLRTLILTNSSVPKDSLAVLGDVLGKCRKLEMLSLKGAPVEQAEHYKEWIVFRCKKLRSLDFDRIKQKDRDHASSLFLNPDGTPTALHTAFLAAAASGAAAPSLVNGAGGAKTFEPGVEPAAAAASGKAGRLLTKEEKERVRQAIEGAESVEEVRRASSTHFGLRVGHTHFLSRSLPSSQIRRLQRMLAQGFVYVLSSFHSGPFLPTRLTLSLDRRPTEKDLRDLERKKAGGGPNGEEMDEE